MKTIGVRRQHNCVSAILNVFNLIPLSELSLFQREKVVMLRPHCAANGKMSSRIIIVESLFILKYLLLYCFKCNVII